MQLQKGEGEIKFDTLVRREKLQSPSILQPVPLGLCTVKYPVFDNQSPGMPYPLLPSIIVIVRSPQLFDGD